MNTFLPKATVFAMPLSVVLGSIALLGFVFEPSMTVLSRVLLSIADWTYVLSLLSWVTWSSRFVTGFERKLWLWSAILPVAAGILLFAVLLVGMFVYGAFPTPT